MTRANGNDSSTTATPARITHISLHRIRGSQPLEGMDGGWGAGFPAFSHLSSAVNSDRRRNDADTTHAAMNFEEKKRERFSC